MPTGRVGHYHVGMGRFWQSTKRFIKAWLALGNTCANRRPPWGRPPGSPPDQTCGKPPGSQQREAADKQSGHQR
jgi:hypothetical protein